MAEFKREYYPSSNKLKSECFEVNDMKEGEYKKFYQKPSFNN